MSDVSAVGMPRMDLKGLIALNALLEERNVGRAAAILGVSPSAVSAALQRLRRQFGDELLQRRGNAYGLTSVAQELHRHAIQALCEAAEQCGCHIEPGTRVPPYTVLASHYAASRYRRSLSIGPTAEYDTDSAKA